MSGREKALSLLAQANNHGDLAVKISSLNQAKAILLASSVDPTLAADLFPYLADLQYSPESLLRKTLIQAVEEIGLKAMDHLSLLMPVLLALLKDNVCILASQSIVSGTNIFCAVLEELCLQFNRHGMVERWLEELWTWMVRFKDAVLNILWEAAPLGTKLLALKFMESYVLIFTSDTNGSEQHCKEARRGQAVNISWVVGGHPFLDPVSLTSEANRLLGVLMDLLRSASSLPGPLTISVVNCLAAVARKRPLHYNSILSALLDFEPNIETVKGGHMASIHYSLRTAYLGFLRCTHPIILESRDRVLRALRGMNAGDAADQAIRQADKMIKANDRASRDARLIKDDQPENQVFVGGDAMKKRSMPLDDEESVNGPDVASKRNRHGPNNHSGHPGPTINFGQDCSVNGISSRTALPDSLTPAEQMITMIGALMAEGDRGVRSLEVLINQIHPDLLADIVITNMKHLPKKPPRLPKVTSQPVTQQSGPSGPTSFFMSTVSASSFSSAAVSTSLPEASTPNLPADSKRDPRRDPRRLDPRRAAIPVEVPPMPAMEENNAADSELVDPFPLVTSVENYPVPPSPKLELDLPNMEMSMPPLYDQRSPKEEVLLEETKEMTPTPEISSALDPTPLPGQEVDEEVEASKPSDIAMKDEDDPLSLFEPEELSPPSSNVAVAEEVCPDLPVVSSYVDLTEDQQINVRKLAVQRIIESYKYMKGADSSLTRMTLLARLVAQIDANDDALVMLQEHVVSDYQLQKGHELVMHVLYHLHTLMISDSVEQSSFAAVVYEKFLLGVAKSLLDALPASDKSFSRLFGEAPLLPGSALSLLDNLCYSNHQFEKGVRDGDRVTQGLGAVWSLILGRPVNRQACLDIALKCAVHSEDDIRAKAIRLVANKLYPLDYISVGIEQFATRMLSSVVDQCTVDREFSQSASNEQRITEVEASERGSQETSISGSQFSEPGLSENDSIRGTQYDSRNDSSLPFAEAQRLISLFFALCTKRPTLLQFVFESYARAPKSVKQAIHRHIPILVRSLGASYSELLRIVSNPPPGSENLLTQVLNILCEETTPSADLIAAVKHLYETNLKDAAILIPILSSLSKTDVLPIFPRLVELPLDKFQTALAHILQGSAHTGPALTPAEVLVAIHGITPEKDGLPLKKITDVCTACFEQRTVFTQQVLAKALNQMVDQSPLPLLFMRTVIQAIDAFPSLVDFVMEILSKLVTKQIWRMPKLWVGFLKCVSQTQPHSFRVLLQLPPPQLESALNKYASLRGPLTSYANQPSLRSSLPRSTLLLLGIVNESHNQQRQVTSSLHASDASSSVQGASIT